MSTHQLIDITHLGGRLTLTTEELAQSWGLHPESLKRAVRNGSSPVRPIIPGRDDGCSPSRRWSAPSRRRGRADVAMASVEKAGNDVGRVPILFGQPVSVHVEGHGRAGVNTYSGAGRPCSSAAPA